MKRSPQRASTVLLVALLAVALATAWFAVVPRSFAPTPHGGDPRSSVTSTGHDVLSTEVSVGRPQAEWTMAAMQSAAPASRTELWSSRLPAGPSAPRSMTIGLLLPPLRI